MWLFIVSLISFITVVAVLCAVALSGIVDDEMEEKESARTEK